MGAGYQSNTISPGPRSTPLPSDRSNRLATTHMGRKVRGAVPLFSRGAESPSNIMWPGPNYMHNKFHLHLSKRLATVHQCQRQTVRDRHTGQHRANRFTDGLPKMVSICYQTVVCLYCLSVLSCPVCDVGVLWPNGSMAQDETSHACRRRPWPHCVKWGPSSPSPKGQIPNFRPISVVAKWLDGSRCRVVGR